MNSGEGTELPTIRPGTAPTESATFPVSPEQIAGAPMVAPSPAESSVGQAIRTASIAGPSSLNPPAGFLQLLTGAQRAGLDLANFVLRIITWAIPGLIISLLVIEFFNFQLYEKTNHDVLQALTAGNDANSSLPLRRAAVAAIFRAVRDQSKPAIANSDVILVDDFVRSLASSGRLPTDKIKILETCATQLHPTTAESPLVSVADRSTATNACLDVLNALNIVPALDSQQLQGLRDISKDALDARQAARSFWLQIVQLVLLNLLLPTLTALLGYIFGSQPRSS